MDDEVASILRMHRTLLQPENGGTLTDRGIHMFGTPYSILKRLWLWASFLASISLTSALPAFAFDFL